MSAFIVDKDHIIYLVSAALNYASSWHGSFSWYHNGQRGEIRSGDYERAADAANMLWRENIRSVSHRYPNESSATLPGPRGETFEITARDIPHFVRVESVQVLKSCSCFEYQSCEHDEWEKSEVFAFIQSLKDSAINALPGYDKAKWGAPPVKQFAIA